MGCNESIKIILNFVENVIRLMNVIKLKIARTLNKLKSSEIEHLIFLTEHKAISVCVSDLSFAFYSVYKKLSHDLCISALKNLKLPNYLFKYHHLYYRLNSF